MIKNCYINGVGCISAQKTYDGTFLNEIIDHDNEPVVNVVKPEYHKYISPSSVRRMSSGVKNGIVASTLAMDEANIEQIDAIITGTGLGCLQDSEKFLKCLIEHDEEYLTPTPFIQSTHNTVAGQIALMHKCKGYNFTYVNTSSSFNAALLDGLMQIQTNEAKSVLVGGVDEIAPHTTSLFQIIEHYKSSTTNKNDSQNGQSKGHVCGEGCAFFVIESEKKESSYCEVVDVHFLNRLSHKAPNEFIVDFIRKNQLELDAVDAVILGCNNDVSFDHIYDGIQHLFSTSHLLTYKHLFGEFMTSTGVATWMACQIFKTSSIPKELVLQEGHRPIKNILIYNQYRDRDHSLILLKNV